MLNLQLARKYSTAVFELAQDENKLEEYGKELSAVSQAVSSNADLEGFLVNPQIQRETKKNVLTKLFKDDLSKTVFNFLMLLVDKRREALIAEIATEYQALSNRARGIVIADITTAKELQAQQADSLQAKLEQITGKTITMRKHINAAIIGGVIVQMGDKRIDGSISGRMESLKAQLLAN